MPEAEISGLRVNYEIKGYGDPIVMLHHGFGCMRMWDHVVPLLVEAGYKTICYDRRGFGVSDPGADFFDFYVGDTFNKESVRELEELRDWLGIPSFHLVGQCEGGVVAFEYAAAYPERVSSIVMSSTLCHSAVTMAEFNASKFLKSFGELDPEMREKFISWHGERAESLFEQFRKWGGMYGKSYFDIRPVLPHVQCPTLILYPDRSFLFEVEQGLAFYRNLPNAQLAVLPDCGHNTYDEQPEAYARHVADFLTRRQYGRKGRMKGEEKRTMTCAG
jgi:pimeloyl-ACP methyl ester carboxylesterase